MDFYLLSTRFNYIKYVSQNHPHPAGRFNAEQEMKKIDKQMKQIKTDQAQEWYDSLDSKPVEEVKEEVVKVSRRKKVIENGD